MELILINTDKIKIILTKKDMDHYGIHIDFHLFTLGRTGSIIREAFSDVLEKIKNETGFDALSIHSVIQVYPSRDGGCELYITKLDKGGENRMNDSISTEKCDTCVHSAKYHRAHLFFSFDNPIDLIDACVMLTESIPDTVSSLFRLDGSYILALECGTHKEKAAPFIKLYDFGNEISEHYFEEYLNEHGTCLIDSNAAKKLGTRHLHGKY